jgi:uncharacterized membrane protein YccC
MKNTVQTGAEEKTAVPEKRSKIKSWVSALKHSWRSALQIDSSQVTAARAIPGAIAFAIPLALGVATGHVVGGVSMAGGAATIATVGLTYTYRARMRTMLLACLAIAFSAFVGSITGHIAWLSILVAGVWGVGAGLLVALGQPAMIVGLQAALALIILSHFELDPLHALIQASLMLAGALLATVLALIPIPSQQTAPERAALSAVYQRLADYALSGADEQSGQRIRDALLKANTVLSDSDAQSQQEKIFLELLEEAERIRLTLIVLRRLRESLKEGATGQSDIVDALDSLLQATADQLRDIANDLKITPQFIRRHRIKPLQQMKQALLALRQQEPAPSYQETLQQVLTYANTLRDQLHTARKLAKSWRYQQYHLSVQVYVPRLPHLRVHDTWSILRANLSLHSTIFRHAIRLGVALALATALYHIFPQLFPRGYWIPLTALLVLRPDFTTTFSRGVARLLGTILGAVLTTVLLAVLAPNNELLVILDIIMAYLAFSVLFVNYALFSVFVTAEVVFLLTFVDPQPLSTVADRALNTVVGGILALLIYLLWPSWESSQVPDNLANRIEAVRHYLAAVLEMYANPAAYDEHKLFKLRRKMRLARSNADASIQHSLHEPAPHRFDPDLAQGLFAAADKIAQSGLTLEAYLIDNPAHHALPEISPFAREVDQALELLTNALRNQQSISTFPDLHKALDALKHAEKSAPNKPYEERADLRFVLTEAKNIVNNISTMRQLLSNSQLSPSN